jgi:hypothetical protein
LSLQIRLCSSPRGSIPWQPSVLLRVQAAVDYRYAHYSSTWAYSATARVEPFALRTIFDILTDIIIQNQLLAHTKHINCTYTYNIPWYMFRLSAAIVRE